MSDRLISIGTTPPWRRRLTLPAYQVNEAARYARITSQTIRNWQSKGETGKAAVAHREKGKALSYFQLVEVAFVAVMRRMGLPLVVIKDARDFIAQRLNSEFPFVENRFRVQGARILMNLSQFESGASGNKLVVVSHGGQLEWGEMLGRKFEEFDYKKGLAVRWHIAGRGSPILIDPQIAFGAPQIRGVPTWAINGRQKAGESLADIADDFSLKIPEVEKALQFETEIAEVANV
jgi:uncharacterized protein (DUF433 family)